MSPATAHTIRAAVDSYQGGLVLYAARLLGDDERARDIVQEVFLRLCRQDPARLDGHLPEWLYAVCRNLAIDDLRRRRRLAEADDLDAQPSAVEAPPALVERDETAGDLLRAVDALPPRQREVVRLRFQHGLSYRQIAAVVGLSESNVGFLLHVALKRLRARLSGAPIPAEACHAPR